MTNRILSIGLLVAIVLILVAMIYALSAKPASAADHRCEYRNTNPVLLWLEKGRCDGGTPGSWTQYRHGPGHDDDQPERSRPEPVAPPEPGPVCG